MNRILGMCLLLSGVLTEAYPIYQGLNNMDDIIDLSFLGNDLYGKPDWKNTGVLVANYNYTDDNEINPEELGTYLEGDMLVPRSRQFLRSGHLNPARRWSQGIVPYEIVGNFTDQEIDRIKLAMEAYHNRTCIRFVPHEDEVDYIKIKNDETGCWSAVGRLGGKQELNFQTPSCLRKFGTLIHEMMHTIGFFHEQNKENRDDYVTIKPENIRSDMIRNFRKENHTLGFGVTYDYGSIMHYSRKAFTINGRSTIKPIKKLRNGVQLGQRFAFSEGDVIKINRMYNCTIKEKLSPPPEDYTEEEESEEDTKEETIEDTETSQKNGFINTYPLEPFTGAEIYHSDSESLKPEAFNSRTVNQNRLTVNQAGFQLKPFGEKLYMILNRLYLKFGNFLIQ